MSPNISLPFGALLRRSRMLAGLTQEALAERAGLTANAIGALERGERQHPYPHTLSALADALRLTDVERAHFIASVVRPAPAAAPTDAAATQTDPNGETILLASKLYPPHVPAMVVARPRLLARLTAGRRPPDGGSCVGGLWQNHPCCR